MTSGTRSPHGPEASGDSSFRLVDTYWGDVHEDSSDIHTEIGVVAPNLLAAELTGVQVEYEAALNDVPVASAERTGLKLGPDTTKLNVDAEFRHDSVPEWWKTHVENGERTVISVEPRLNFDVERALDIRFPLTDVSLRTPRIRRSFETDVLEGVEDTPPQETTVLGRTVFVVEDVEAEWGEPTEDETPVEVEATVTNPTRFRLPFGDLRYEIRMNDVVVGEGEVDHGGFPARTTKQVETSAAVEVDRLVEWWPTHVSEDDATGVEETVLEVEFYADVGPYGLGPDVTVFEHRDTVETGVFTN